MPSSLHVSTQILQNNRFNQKSINNNNIIRNYKKQERDTGSTSVSVYPQSITKAELIPKVMIAMRWLGANSTEGTCKTRRKKRVKLYNKHSLQATTYTHQYGSTYCFVLLSMETCFPRTFFREMICFKVVPQTVWRKPWWEFPWSVMGRGWTRWWPLFCREGSLGDA